MQHHLDDRMRARLTGKKVEIQTELLEVLFFEEFRVLKLNRFTNA